MNYSYKVSSRFWENVNKACIGYRYPNLLLKLLKIYIVNSIHKQK